MTKEQKKILKKIVSKVPSKWFKESDERFKNKNNVVAMPT